MNNEYYQPNLYPSIKEEELYLDSILKLNKGKMIKLNVTIPGSIEWQDQVFEGILESAGKDNIIISNPNTGEWNIIPMIYLDYITLEEPVKYNK